MEKKKLLSPSVKTSNGLKPYEQWKENCVTQQETVVLGEGKRILNVFDQSSRSYLTKESEIGPNKNDYKSLAKVYHGKHLAVDSKHIDLDKGVHKTMKTTTYSIGKKGQDAPNEIVSSFSFPIQHILYPLPIFPFS